jgi:hypothetical protein
MNTSTQAQIQVQAQAQDTVAPHSHPAGFDLRPDAG